MCDGADDDDDDALDNEVEDEYEYSDKYSNGDWQVTVTHVYCSYFLYFYCYIFFQLPKNFSL